MRAAKRAADKVFFKEVEKRQEIDLERLDGDDLIRELIYTMQETNVRLKYIDIDIVRIRNNVVFFFWLTILTLLGWILGLIVFGGLVAALSTI